MTVNKQKIMVESPKRAINWLPLQISLMPQAVHIILPIPFENWPGWEGSSGDGGKS